MSTPNRHKIVSKEALTTFVVRELRNRTGDAISPTHVRLELRPDERPNWAAFAPSVTAADMENVRHALPDYDLIEDDAL
jgi:hypothetical protein